MSKKSEQKMFFIEYLFRGKVRRTYMKADSEDDLIRQWNENWSFPIQKIGKIDRNHKKKRPEI